MTNGGQNNSLKLDEQGHAHISHYNGNQMSLEYAFRGDSGWEICTVYSDWPDYACGLNSSIALDSSGNPHIGFLIMDTVGWYKSVLYAYKDEQGWHTSYTCCGGFRGDVSGPSLALTSEGIPCMAVDAHDPTDEWDRILYFLHKPDASWVSESVPGSGGSWGAVSMDVDSAGRPHIAYEKWMYQGLHYAYMAQDSADLSIEENEDSVILSWEPYPETALYEIHGAGNNPYFFIAPQPGTDYLITTVPSSQNSWETTYGIGDPDENWAFLIIAKDETDTELARSNRVGEHDFLLDYPE